MSGPFRVGSLVRQIDGLGPVMRVWGINRRLTDKDGVLFDIEVGRAGGILYRSADLELVAPQQKYASGPGGLASRTKGLANRQREAGPGEDAA